MSTQTEHGPSGESLQRRHEQRDLRIRTLMLGLVVLGVLVAASVLAMKGLQELAETRARAREPQPSPLAEAGVVPPQPRLESTPGEILARLRALETMQLTGYGWVDRPSGIAKIPVHRAMEIIAERGLPPVPASGAQEVR